MRSITHFGAGGGGRVLSRETEMITKPDGSRATRTREEVRMRDGTVITRTREEVVETAGRVIDDAGKTRDEQRAGVVCRLITKNPLCKVLLLLWRSERGWWVERTTLFDLSPIIVKPKLQADRPNRYFVAFDTNNLKYAH